MSINNLGTATGQLMPQLVTSSPFQSNSNGNCQPTTGQILVVTHNQHQPGVPPSTGYYFVPHRQYINPSSAGGIGLPSSMFAPLVHALPQPQPVVQQSHQTLPAPQPQTQQIHRNNPPTLALPPPQVRQHQQKVKHSSISKRSVEYSFSTIQLKDHSTVKAGNVEEKCFHYINGQLIIESSKPLNDLKLETFSKKEKKRQSSSISSSIQDNNKQVSKKIRIQKIPQNSPQLQNTVETVAEIRSNPIQTTATSSTLMEAKVDDVQKIRGQMPQWSVNDVVKFIEEHEDIRQYAHKFADDEVDGKALLLMIDRNLNLERLASMFKHGPAMKIEAVLSKYKQ